MPSYPGSRVATWSNYKGLHWSHMGKTLSCLHPLEQLGLKQLEYLDSYRAVRWHSWSWNRRRWVEISCSSGSDWFLVSICCVTLNVFQTPRHLFVSGSKIQILNDSYRRETFSDKLFGEYKDLFLQYQSKTLAERNGISPWGEQPQHLSESALKTNVSVNWSPQSTSISV